MSKEFCKRIQKGLSKSNKQLEKQIFELFKKLQDQLKDIAEQKTLRMEEIRWAKSGKGMVRCLQASYGDDLKGIYRLDFQELQEVYASLHYVLSKHQRINSIDENQVEREKGFDLTD